MAVTAETRTGLIGLSVAMLGSAPGTDLLNEWVAAHEDGMSLEDIANHIAGSDAFQATYPAFLTPEEFAEDFLGNVLGGNVSDEVMTGAEDIVVGMLNDGMTRGALALAVVNALHDIAMTGMDHPAYGDLGMAAMAFHNQIEVAEHYTLNARMAEHSASVLEGVTADADSVAMAIDAIDNPVMEDPMMGMRYILTPTIDVFNGGDGDDTFVAQPEQGADGLFNETLSSFDSIDGGAGNDTIHVFGVNTGSELILGAEDIRNVENLVINTVGGVNADLSDWEGLESVSLERFGRDDETSVEVTVDGAMVSSDRTFHGNVEIVGAGGAVDIEAGPSSMVHIGSGGHTGSVMVKSGMSVTIGKNAGGGQSQTVTSVSVDGVVRDMPKDTGELSDTRSHYNLRTDFDGFVLAPNGDRVNLTHADTNGGSSIEIKVAKDAMSKDLVNVTDAGDTALTSGDYTLQYHPENGILVWTYTGTEVGEAIPAAPTALPTTDVSMERIEYFAPLPPSGGGNPTLKVHSDAIETVQLHNTQAVVLVQNESKMADGKDMPEDLSITVNHYGSFNTNGTPKMAGKLCIKGAGSAENIDITVVGNSYFDLASDEVKMLAVDLGANNLVLDVNKFDNMTASNSLAMLTVIGDGKFTTDASGMAKLATIDASGNMGANTITAGGAALASVMTGAGGDKLTLTSSATAKLASVSSGGGNDMVTVTGAHRGAGLMVDLGAGDDTFHGNNGGSDKSRVDGGEGMDTLKLSVPDKAYKDGATTKSIFSNFEILDVGGSTGGTYDVARLGVDTVVARGGTKAKVTLKDMADGMGITVHGAKGMAEATMADIVHMMPAETRVRYSGELDVNLLAIGGDTDTKSADGTMGEVSLMLKTDSEIEALNVDSSAMAGGSKTSPATNRPGAANYQNMLTLDAESSANIEDIYVSGNAMLVIKIDSDATAGALGELDLIDASDNTGGVIFDGTNPDRDDGTNSLANALGNLELVGGSGMDMLTGGGGNDEIEGNDGMDTLNGGAGADELTGGAGGDILIGGAGNDMFIIKAVSDSQLSFKNGAPIGMDTIGDATAANQFVVADDSIVLPKALRDSFQGVIKAAELDNVDTNAWVIDAGDPDVDHDSDGNTPDIDDSHDTLQAFVLANANGFFETRTPTDGGFGGSINKHSVAVVHEADNGTNQDTWVFIDIDGDGDLDIATDHVIKLAGNIDLTTADFVAG